MSFYEARNIHFSYQQKKVLDGVSVSIPKGSIVSLLGANGAGKSTLMKILLGLLSPDQGEVILEEKNLTDYSIKKRAEHIAYVPQSTKIVFAFSALQIVLMGRIAFEAWFAKASSEHDKQVCYAAMERLGIAHLAERNYQTLSGGEKQLVLIARALAQGAKILVMDEPISGLDYGNQLRLLEAILTLCKEGYTFLKSTHFPEHALMLEGQTYALKDGKILANGDTKSVVTEALINTLYQTDITLCTTHFGYKACVPNFLNQRI
ncbi:MAG: ABC transporter ATP-binding protein [Epsilonproteobacteria bacterium]|nr:ABC transporter ATP-binding protein [Campylobacterota bacterium]